MAKFGCGCVLSQVLQFISGCPLLSSARNDFLDSARSPLGCWWGTAGGEWAVAHVTAAKLQKTWPTRKRPFLTGPRAYTHSTHRVRLQPVEPFPFRRHNGVAGEREGRRGEVEGVRGLLIQSRPPLILIKYPTRRPFATRGFQRPSGRRKLCQRVLTIKVMDQEDGMRRTHILGTE